jgi:hypothetical protein
MIFNHLSKNPIEISEKNFQMLDVFDDVDYPQFRIVKNSIDWESWTMIVDIDADIPIAKAFDLDDRSHAGHGQ